MLVNTPGLKTTLSAIKEYVLKQISSLYQTFKSLIKQPDWNQNDESAQDYIKNRTHWKESKFTTITGFDAWANITSMGKNPIPLVEINGVKYANVLGTIQPPYVAYSFGSGFVRFNCRDRYIYIDGFEPPISEDDILFWTDVTEIKTIPEEYIPDTIARAEQIVQPDWNIAEPFPGSILNKPRIGYHNIVGVSTSDPNGTVIPTFSIPSDKGNYIVKIEKLMISNYSDGDYIRITDSSREIDGSIMQGNDLMFCVSIGGHSGKAYTIVTKSGDEYAKPVLAFAIDFYGFPDKEIRIYSPTKQVRCMRYNFYST